MAVTREYLEEQIKQLQVQESQHIAAAHAARGAIQLAEHLLSQLESQAMTVSDLEAMTGGKVERIIPVNESHQVD